MKTIGLLGGMSWESTALYYRLINEATRKELGQLHSAPIAMVSVDFAEIEQLQQLGAWRDAGALLAQQAQRVEAAGADFLLICTNTMHKVADEVAAAISIPLLHLADATALEVIATGLSCVGLLGTRFTMEQEFYRSRLEAHGLQVLVPAKDDRDIVHRVIYEELCLGRVEDQSRIEYQRIIEELGSQGAQAVIAGCTEITMLVDPKHSPLKMFDTTAIHAQAAVTLALANDR
ncbi:MAG: aspartate/glutamate racemase family protein [Halioglobus sp.]